MRTTYAVSDSRRSCRWGTVRPCNQLEPFPVHWRDPLELYGKFRVELRAPDFDSTTERNQVNELIKMYSAEWVWSNRHRLVSLRKLLSRAETGEFNRGTGRSPVKVCHGSTL